MRSMETIIVEVKQVPITNVPGRTMTKYLIECHNCHKRMWGSGDRARRQLFCNRECTTAWARKNAKEKRPISGVCKICGKPTESFGQVSARKTCSKECLAILHSRSNTQSAREQRAKNNPFVQLIDWSANPKTDPRKTKRGYDRVRFSRFICPKCGNMWKDYTTKAPIANNEGFSRRQFPSVNEAERTCPHCLSVA